MPISDSFSAAAIQLNDTDHQRKSNTGWIIYSFFNRTADSNVFFRRTMAVHTSLLDFHVDPAIISSAEIMDALQFKLENIFKDRHLNVVYRSKTDGGFFFFLVGPRESHASVKCHAKGLLTVTLEEHIGSAKWGLFSAESTLSELELAIKEATQSVKNKKFPPIKRGTPVDLYGTSSDNRLLEYDFDELLYEANSAYQNIKIVHSLSFGNLLVLDELQNLAESDIIYTHTLMRYGELDYKNKTILILGGGDGGLLHELLKENPAHVIMIEIDQMVMEACRIHLRSVCGDCLDTYKGSNYEIIVDDCVKVMEEFVKEAKTFDFVFGDLTDIPITPTPQGEVWDFVRKILDLTFRILAPEGKFLTHGNGVSSQRALEIYEQQLRNLHCVVEFKRHTAYVPSFLECWVFYEVWKKNEEQSYANGDVRPII